MRSSLNQHEYQLETSLLRYLPFLAVLRFHRYFAGFAVFSGTNTRADRRGNTLPRILAVSLYIFIQ